MKVLLTLCCNNCVAIILFKCLALPPVRNSVYAVIHLDDISLHRLCKVLPILITWAVMHACIAYQLAVKNVKKLKFTN